MTCDTRKILVVEPTQENNLGARLLLRSLVAAGLDAQWQANANSRQMDLFASSAPPGGIAAVYVSVLYLRQYLSLPRLFRRLGIPLRAECRDNRHPLVVFGGQATIAPAPIEPFADVVALGDGEVTGVRLGTMIQRGMGKQDLLEWCHQSDGYYIPTLGGTLVGAYAETIQPRLVGTGGRAARPTIEVARGCRRKCKFCAIGWAGGRYREAREDEVRRALVGIGRKCNLYAPDPPSLSYYESLQRHLRERGIVNSSTDVSIEALQFGAERRSAYIGVDGISGRLRRAIGKPASHDLIVAKIGSVADHLSLLKLYFVGGLPEETPEDWVEFWALLDGIRSVYRGKVEISLNHLLPVPHTPLEFAPGRYNLAVLREMEFDRDKFRERWRTYGEMWTFLRVKGQDLHELEVLLQRGGRDVAGLIEALDGADPLGRACRWRRCASRLGIDVDGLLDCTIGSNWRHIAAGARCRKKKGS